MVFFSSLQTYFLCALTSETPGKFLWGFFSNSSQCFGSEKQFASYWWISWRNNMQGNSHPQPPSLFQISASKCR
jgi:hypothetical protein